MDYNPLIDKAKVQQKWTSDYKVAQALEYKNKSVIYQIRRGVTGMSADRLARLMELAGVVVKTLAGVAILISVALPYGTGEAQAENHGKPLIPHEFWILC
jgi:hypothetical protein